jgi:hypothetical protein
MKPTVKSRLEDLADIHAERQAIYGDNYMYIGEIMMGMFPRGMHIKTAEEFNRLHLFFHLVGKLSRYARQMPDGGHDDSLDDTAVYAMILRHYDFLTAGNSKGK